MNRLVIIGNGFDLAHGLETSYNDFVAYYLFNFIDKASSASDKHEDELLSAISPNTEKFEAIKIESLKITDVYERIKYLLQKLESEKLVEFKGNLPKLLFKGGADSRWVDIEYTYYRSLCIITEPKLDSRFSDGKTYTIKDLNVQFEFLKKELIEYLKSIDKKTDQSQSIIQKIYEPIRFFNSIDKEYIEIEAKNTYVLNFNYTHTPRYYNKEDDSFEILNIHGSLDDEENPPIFGWGDDTNEKYKSIENLNDNAYLEYFKSFDYLRNETYQKLFNFLDFDSFQVQIMGHSCGISDRTMLNAIFEHENCLQIKPFYYKWDRDKDDYTQKTMEISRHFKNKHKMRRIIVEKENTKCLS